MDLIIQNQIAGLCLGAGLAIGLFLGLVLVLIVGLGLGIGVGLTAFGFCPFSQFIGAVIYDP